MNQAISIVPFKIKISLSLKPVLLLLFFITLSLLAFSIYQFNSYTEDIYFISRAERQIISLSQENKVLEIELAKANSLVNMNQYLDNFEKADNITYIRVLQGTALAQ